MGCPSPGGSQRPALQEDPRRAGQRAAQDQRQGATSRQARQNKATHSPPQQGFDFKNRRNYLKIYPALHSCYLLYHSTLLLSSGNYWVKKSKESKFVKHALNLDL